MELTELQILELREQYHNQRRDIEKQQDTLRNLYQKEVDTKVKLAALDKELVNTQNESIKAQKVLSDINKEIKADQLVYKVTKCDLKELQGQYEDLKKSIELANKDYLQKKEEEFNKRQDELNSREELFNQQLKDFQANLKALEAKQARILSDIEKQVKLSNENKEAKEELKKQELMLKDLQAHLIAKEKQLTTLGVELTQRQADLVRGEDCLKDTLFTCEASASDSKLKLKQAQLLEEELKKFKEQLDIQKEELECRSHSLNNQLKSVEEMKSTLKYREIALRKRENQELNK